MIKDSNPATGSQSTGTEHGRGGTILAFGIISLLFMGPLLGIPAWVMGNTDLKKIRRGTIDPSHKGKTRTGMILGIAGTFFLPSMILLVILLSLFSAADIQVSRAAIIADMSNVAVHAYQYRMRPASQNGGDGTYVGYSIPRSLQSNENATYSVVGMPTSTTITIRGVSAQFPEDSVEGTFGPDGKRIGQFTFNGPNFPRFP